MRQLVLSGEGDTDAGMTILGLFAGAAIAHNFGLASSASGSTELGRWAVVVGLVIAAAIGFLMRERVSVTRQPVPSGAASEP